MAEASKADELWTASWKPAVSAGPHKWATQPRTALTWDRDEQADSATPAWKAPVWSRPLRQVRNVDKTRLPTHHPVMIHLHLDPLGGMAGDMFAAALLSAFPEHENSVAEAVAKAVPVRCRTLPHNDGVLAGLRFRVEGADGRPADAPAATSKIHAHGHEQGHTHDHHRGSGQGHDHDDAHEHDHRHREWRQIRAELLSCGLDPAILGHAVGIFAVLAKAEGRVHGVSADAVSFHEVGAADSIADIVAAAVLIDAVGAESWSVSALPLGSGRVRTAHGIMPVPPPATVLLLEGFDMLDDGIPGERVTPTGAAILRYLKDTGMLGKRPPGRMAGSGIGFGTKILPGTSNCVRVLVTETARPSEPATGHRSLGVIAFEVDDQSGEDLAAGLDRVRAVDGVHDVVQMAAIGKKSRMAVHVQVLAAPDALPAVTAACFRETTTIGLRTHLVEGQALRRRIAHTIVDGASVDVKLVDRPDGWTGKAEADHLLGLPGHASRARLRRQAEALAMDRDETP